MAEDEVALDFFNMRFSGAGMIAMDVLTIRDRQSY